MNEHPELATALLAVAFSAVVLVTGQLYMEHRTTQEMRVTQQASVKEGVDLRRVSQVSPYMRSER
ncbi:MULTISPECIES: hypothetical protein [Bradyrhizobium]|uniref:Uncharacterized protein n=1 Tax=Bradyrhizobium canariense TaxID=255045 RepID=A0A1X3GSF2_9BRAD|nr:MULTISPECIES: hypothetical protein [Bradyrhizobium]OSI71605.1 hypothetical protein BSZ22_10965 [Bradyrhizobium canariense]OSI80567.1 hypothetical protein BSZ23_10680 [Bradyrhizobium canariense]OSI91170.1 hypothetical protein BSZ25_16250 [Bradyrhizobium canariense]OSI96242.1 hypothetical protein BSZ24_05065 [Bradyrhizobium canariense]OSJ09222.1 hypothetical protein BSZ16_06885 [Bradyrhizobium canariense]